jgi:hypothetical protein
VHNCVAAAAPLSPEAAFENKSKFVEHERNNVEIRRVAAAAVPRQPCLYCGVVPEQLGDASPSPAAAAAAVAVAASPRSTSTTTYLHMLRLQHSVIVDCNIKTIIQLIIALLLYHGPLHQIVSATKAITRHMTTKL